MAEAPVSPPVSPPVAPPVVPAKWWDGKADAITVGYLQNRGLHDKTPEEVALSVAKAHMEAEKFIGAPADQLIRLPKDKADQAGWQGVFDKLGALKDGQLPSYDGASADGKALTKEVQDLATMIGYRTHMTPEAAVFAAQEIQKFIGKGLSQVSEKIAADLAVAKDALNKNWGVNFNGNKVVADNAMRALGVTPEQQAAAENMLGYDKMMEMFRQIGVKMGEDKYVSNANTSGLPVQKTREQINQRITELKNDKAWVARYMDGGLEEKKELLNLQRLLHEPVR